MMSKFYHRLSNIEDCPYSMFQLKICYIIPFPTVLKLTTMSVMKLAFAKELYTQYKFILSPKGHGLDCHRTFEILLLGGIPVLEYFTGVMA